MLLCNHLFAQRHDHQALTAADVTAACTHLHTQAGSQHPPTTDELRHHTSNLQQHSPRSQWQSQASLGLSDGDSTQLCAVLFQG